MLSHLNKVIILFLLTIGADAVLAETLIMQNGSRIKGKILNQNINEIQLESETGEVIQISKNKLSRILFKDNSEPKVRNIIPDPEPVLKTEEKPIEPPKPVMIYEVTKDNKIYLIDVIGEKFPESVKVSLEADGIIIPQKIRKVSDKYFELCIDPENLPIKEYNLIIDIGSEIIRRDRFIEVVTKASASSVIDSAQK
jgi:hypothetical protein